MNTHTQFIRWSRIGHLDDALPVIRVALVCNDLAIANSSMKHYTDMQSNALEHIRRGGRMYFSRLMCGHLNEGMEALKEVRNTQHLMTIVKQCDQRGRRAFDKLCRCLPGGEERNSFERYIGWVRNRVAFHYDPNDLKWAIQDRAKRPNANTASLTAGKDIHTTRFEFGDALLDSVVCRRLWKIPKDKKVQEEADRIGNWCNEKCLAFLQFGAEFVPQFLKGRATV